MVKLRGDSLTGDLLAWEPPKVAAGFEPGAIRGNRLASQISQAVALALKSSSMSRAEIAAAMSIELGYQISENMLANYASEGAETHRITLERFIALIEVTGCVDLLGFIAGRFGQVVVDRKYQALINVHLADEAEQKIQKFKAAEKAKWGAI
ncbi:phage regulatory CII family protein [Brucella inopinata]|uniref:Uncharacterized protein n=1 Tax=Brucella inopinata TaxID=1218315 RepID=A0AAW7B7J0_9HYPH|nr:hypothetical protein [Brucella inopinata]MDL2332872.1 hypothetical protein [Brucella inopinata]